jgi:hypothetical protein
VAHVTTAIEPLCPANLQRQSSFNDPNPPNPPNSPLQSANRGRSRRGDCKTRVGRRCVCVSTLSILLRQSQAKGWVCPRELKTDDVEDAEHGSISRVQYVVRRDPMDRSSESIESRRRTTFFETFETQVGARVKIADVRQALGSSRKSESQGQNFRPWLSNLLGATVTTQTIAGRSYLMGYRMRDGSSRPTSSIEAAPIAESSSIDDVVGILEAFRRLTAEEVGSLAPQIVCAAETVLLRIKQVHDQSNAFRLAFSDLATQQATWASNPPLFLQSILGSRKDVHIRPDYKPFYTVEPSGKRKYWGFVPSPGEWVFRPER